MQTAAAIDARLHQVEREVAGAGADLQRAGERAGVAAEQLLDLAEHLRAPDLAEVDAPLGVVVGRRDVVVAAVDVEDLVGGVGRGHARARSLGRRSVQPDAGPGTRSPRKSGPMICCSRPPRRCSTATRSRRRSASGSRR